MRKILKNITKLLAVNFLPEELFKKDINLETAKALFKTYVEVVEIENHNYCNRTCWFCPNAQIDRRSSVILLAENTYNKILSNLQEIDYSQTLVWSRYQDATFSLTDLKKEYVKNAT